MRMKTMLYNKKGQLDGRNLLSQWSFFKWIVDLSAITAGGGILASRPSTSVFTLVFLLWLWTFIKFVIDTPLVLIWLYGKIYHDKHKKHKKKISIKHKKYKKYKNKK